MLKLQQTLLLDQLNYESQQPIQALQSLVYGKL